MQTKLQRQLIRVRDDYAQTQKNYNRIVTTGDAEEISQAAHWLELVRLALLLSESLVARESLNLEMGYKKPPKKQPTLKGH